MRGFITFVLAAAFVLAVFSIYGAAKTEDSAAQVQKLEKKYYFEMDVKRAIGEGVRQGAAEAEAEFAKCAAEGNCKKGLSEYMREKIGERISTLALYLEGDRDWDIALWCGKTSGDELEGIALRGNPATAMCVQCKSAKEGCGGFVDVDFARRVVRLQKGDVFLGTGEISAIGFGAAEKNGEVYFESYFPPWLEIKY
ncbi:Uncharacterised protein [Candidatus Anstonella stagnisolia]|nr:Uncharacterised protein [Candidatus Anstonella stagnisolia]